MASAPLSPSVADTTLLKSAAFAALCQTTKETLRHYRAIGLLEPVATSPAGYGLYSPLQWADFLLISSLQDSGCSLSDIKRYLDQPAADDLEAVLAERVEALKAERRRLRHQQQLLENTLHQARALGAWLRSGERCRIEAVPEQRFRDTDLSPLFWTENDATAMADPTTARPTAAEAPPILGDPLAAFMDRYRDPARRGLTAPLQSTYRVGLAAFQTGCPETDFHLCVPAAPRSRAADVLVKPAGTYFKWLRITNIADELEAARFPHDAFEQFRAELDARHLTPVGDLYETELSLYSGSLTETVYTEVSILISRS